MHTMSDQLLQEFRAACGADDDIELKITHAGREETYGVDFPLPFVVVGGHDNADLVLSGTDISRRHAYLQMIDGRLRCIDLGSRTGITWDDGDRRAGWFAPGRGVWIGPYRIRHVTAAAAGSAAATDPPDPRLSLAADRGGLPAVRLEFDTEPGPTLWRVNRVLSLVGRSPACKVHLTCPSVCKFHCALLRTGRGLWVADLLGGVSVNGAGVRFARLADGDRLQVGRYDIRVRYESAPLAMARPGPPGGATAGAVASLLSAGLDATDPVLGSLVGQFAQMQQHLVDQFQQTMLALVQTFGNLHRDQTELVRQELDHLHQLTAELNALRGEMTAPAAVDPSPAAAPARAADGPAVAANVPAAPADGRLAAPVPQPQPPDVHAWLQARLDALGRERQGRWQKLLALLRKGPANLGPAAGTSL
jgi:predicted component of type VI protein secretion system